MSDRAEALFVAHRIPYPPNKGDKIRSWRLMKFLADRFDLHLAAFADDPDDLQHEEYLSTFCKSCKIIPLDPAMAKLRSLKGFMQQTPLSFEYFNDVRMHEHLKMVRSRPLALEVAFSSSMASYLSSAVSSAVRVIDFCDADSAKWTAYAQTAKDPMRYVYAREGRLMAKAEAEIINWANASFAITPEEAALLNALPGLRAEVDWWANGVDAEFFSPAGTFSKFDQPADIVFVGAMDYRANVEAVVHFVKNVWPSVLNSRPDARFAIVGRHPVPEVKSLVEETGVEVTGSVDDVRPWLSGAKIVVAPLLVARGVQNKVLEAMAMGKAVVATQAALTGIECDAGSACTADTPEEQANAILRLLRERAEREAMGLAARKTALRAYSWPAQLERFEAAIENELRGQSTSGSSPKSSASP